MAANSLDNASEAIAELGGLAVGGAIVALLGYRWAFGIDALTFVFSAASIALITHRRRFAWAATPGKTVTSEAVEGLRSIWRSDVLRELTGVNVFAAFFAAYAVLSGETAGGPAGKDLFDLKVTAVETGCLLLSSFACGVASIGAQTRRGAWFYGGMAATLVLGTVFLGLEVWEFAGLVARDAGPGRSAFLSAFFALVGCHGLHVGVGLLWLTTMMAQVWAKGYRPDILRRMLCFSLFWHALDIIWVAVFTIVYLMGSGA